MGKRFNMFSQNNFPEKINKLYWSEKMSIPQIAKYYNISVGKIHNLMVKNGIPRRSSMEGRNINPPKIVYKRSTEHHSFGREHSVETREKISKTRTKQRLRSRLGKFHTEETKRKISKANKGRLSGEKHPNWQGGKSSLKLLIKGSAEYCSWRTSVFSRDLYACQFCGDCKGGNLEADHIHPLAIIMYEKNITTFALALSCKELWDINNGRTLCKKCHRGTDTYGVKTQMLLQKRKNV